jgi:pyrimidine operon attenuation protein/uracil phosphoribosyltransferase
LTSLKATVMDSDAIRRSMSRIAHEIVERNHGVDGLVVVGVISHGDVLARRIAAKLSELEGVAVPVGAVDPSGHRDDGRPRRPGRPDSRVPDVADRTVVLVDDVIYHGRTARAAMEALIEFGRPRAIQLAVLIDRGHRQLPIRPDYVGKNVPTSDSERIEVCLEEVEGVDAAVIVQPRDGEPREGGS